MAEIPLITVCMPVYNGEEFLAAAIESVLNQTCGDFELLIADDGSTDDSCGVAERYARADSRIRFWKNPQRLGLFGNYNFTMGAGRGKLLKTFAQDDLLAAGSLESLSAVLLQRPDVALVSSGRQVIDSSGACTYTRSPFPCSMAIPSREAITFNLINLNNWVGEPSTVMFRATHRGAGFDSAYYHYGDIEYWFRILAHGQYYFVNEVLCSFRRHPGSQTDKNHRELYFALDILRLSLSYRHVLEDIEPVEVFRRRVAETVALHLGYAADRYGGDLTGAFETAFVGEQGDQKLSPEALGFRALAAFAFTGMTELMAELDHEKRCRIDENERFAAEVEKMKNSLYWKLTGPLRAVRDALKEP